MKPRLLTLGIALIVLGIIVVFYHQSLTLDNLVPQEARLRDLQRERPLLVFSVAFLIYVALCFMPVVNGKSVAYGWLFGFWQGVLLVNFAATTTAILVLLLSRYVFRDAVQSRYGYHLHRFNEALRREGAWYLFTLRVIVVVPYTFINLVMGLTPMRVRTFWWVSQLGMLPCNLVCIYAGSNLPGLRDIGRQSLAEMLSPQLVLAFILLATFPLAARTLVVWLRADHPPPEQAGES